MDPDGETITASNSFDHAKASNAKSKTSAVETSKRGATGGASGHHNSHSSQETAEKIGHAAGDAGAGALGKDLMGASTLYVDLAR